MVAVEQPARLVSLDAFRGLTIAFMVLVNNPGSWRFVYWPLEHAPWHGWTPTDLVFPFFLFIVGTALHFSRRTSAGAAVRRAAALFGLGLFLNGYPFFHLATWRIPGVLQRIAVCYLAAWAVRRLVGPTGQALVAAGLLALDWALMTQVGLPGGQPPNLEPGANFAAHVDRLFLRGHMWSVTRTWDPEGLVSTLPAIATTLLGCLAGAWLRGPAAPVRKAIGLLGAGLVLLAAGVAWGVSFPVNKALWTSSFVLLTGGLAAAGLGLCYFVADVAGLQRWTRPWTTYGRNAIAVFVGSGLLAKTLALIRWPGPAGQPLSLQARLHAWLFASWLPPFPASAAYALASVGLWYLVALALDRRGLYLKV
ncbi:MAG TPA: heparan-alpha-glucosaminide N-acetyltransferase domain-containing protein [Vicinamibacteria bacterium]